MAVVTIFRGPGAFGREIATRVAGKLGFELVDKVRLSKLWSEVDLDEASLKNVYQSIQT